MNAKKFFTTSLLLAMTLMIALGGIWQPAAAKAGTYPLLEGETIAVGNQGLHASNIPFGVTHVSVDRVRRALPPKLNRKMEVDYSPPALEVRFLNENGGTVDQINAQVYVFFNLTKAEQARWLESGMEKIAIWYTSSLTGSWELCPTFFVKESLDNGTFDRLACVAPGSGTYILGVGDFSEQIKKAESQKSAGFLHKYVPQ